MPRSFPLHSETLVWREDMPLAAITGVLPGFYHTLARQRGD
jgi:hypothetical protein